MSRTLIQKTKKLLASELGTCYGTGGGLVSFALAYPNTYYVGMSNLGFQTVYKILNELPEVVCERVFLPDWEDQKEYRRTNTKLFALESQRPVKDFDILGFSISYELDYLNILKILDFSNIPLRSQERKETEPLIIAGGPCATFNPEPLADFIDAFVIGEAEEVLPEIIEVVKPARRTTIAGGSEKCKEKREEILKALGQIEGVYVPSLYQVEYNQDGTIKSIRPKNGAAPPRIKKRWVKNLDEFETHSVILTPNTEFKNMFLIELTRGCRHLCRFCLAGYCYLPPRARSLENILPLIDRGSELTNKIGLVGAAVSDYPYMEELCEALEDMDAFRPACRRQVSISSLRADTASETLIKMLADHGQQTITLAPEAGTLKLRKSINKDIPTEKIIETASIASKYGIKRLKLYFMLGLPGEEPEEVQEIIHLAEEIQQNADFEQLVLSFNVFVPKPFTAFQWTKMAPLDAIDAKTKLIARLAPLKDKRGNWHFSFESPKWALIQGILARGDRRLSEVIYQAHQFGATLGAWRKAFRITKIDPEFYIYRERPQTETFPWDHLDIGISKNFLWQEYLKSQSLIAKS